MYQFFEAWWDLKGGADLPTYLDALAEREELLRAWNLFMETHPVIVMPSCPEVALPVNLDIEDRAGAGTGIGRAAVPDWCCPCWDARGWLCPPCQSTGYQWACRWSSRRYREDLSLDAGEIVEAHMGSCTPVGPRQ